MPLSMRFPLQSGQDSSRRLSTTSTVVVFFRPDPLCLFFRPAGRGLLELDLSLAGFAPRTRRRCRLVGPTEPDFHSRSSAFNRSIRSSLAISRSSRRSKRCRRTAFSGSGLMLHLTEDTELNAYAWEKGKTYGGAAVCQQSGCFYTCDIGADGRLDGRSCTATSGRAFHGNEVCDFVGGNMVHGSCWKEPGDYQKYW